MKIEFLKKLKEEIELRTLRKSIASLSSEEKSRINKILNFAITWWLKDVNLGNANDNAKDTTIDGMYAYARKELLSDDQLAKIEDFKNELGFSILREMLKKPDIEIELHCGYSPDGILGECIEKSQCQFLNVRIPIKSRMQITREQVYVKEGYGEKMKLAFDVNRKYDFPITNISTVPSIPEEQYEHLTEKKK